MILARQPPVDAAKQRIAWTIVAQSNYDLGAYDKAEPAFAEARELARHRRRSCAPISPSASRPRSTSRAKPSRRRGDGAGAVEDFLRVARVAPDSKIRSTAQYDAAAQLIDPQAVGSRDRGARGFRRDYPEERAAADVTQQARGGVRRGRPLRAGGGGVRAHRRRSDGRPRRCSAKRCCSPRTCTRRPTTRRRPWRCWRSSSPTIRRRSPMRWKRASGWPISPARAATSCGATYWYREIVKADATGGRRAHRSHHVPRGEGAARRSRSRRAMRSAACALTAPLKKSLVAKRKALDAALDAYKQAAEYQVAEVTTAATYEMAELYRTAREGPDGLRAAEERSRAMRSSSTTCCSRSRCSRSRSRRSRFTS